MLRLDLVDEYALRLAGSVRLSVSIAALAFGLRFIVCVCHSMIVAGARSRARLREAMSLMDRLEGLHRGRRFVQSLFLVRSGNNTAMRPRITVRRSPIHGNGVFANRTIAAETEIIEYRGRLLSHDEADERYGGNVDEGHTYLFTLNDEFVIDGDDGGNSARWINHSCAPNCRALTIEHASGDPRRDRIVIESLREIAEGEELSFDYGIRLDVAHTAKRKRIWACRCGSDACTGTMLKPK